MNFLVNDEVRNTMRDRNGTLKGFENALVALVDYGKGLEKTSIQYLELIGKGTDVHQALRNDPEALTQFAEHFLRSGRIEISCQSSKVERLAAEVSEVSSLSEIEAFDYIRPVTEKSHAAKFDILVANDLPEGLAIRLGVYFKSNGLRAKAGEYQINSRSLAEWLMQAHNVLPVKQV
jgi:hypothetical protein